MEKQGWALKRALLVFYLNFHRKIEMEPLLKNGPQLFCQGKRESKKYTSFGEQNHSLIYFLSGNFHNKSLNQTIHM